MASIVTRAICEILPNDHGIIGTIYFTQIGEKTIIQGEIKNLKKGLHGFHVHTEGKDVIQLGKQSVKKCCDLMGGHYDPFGQEHGYPDSDKRHVGDLGNIYANEYGISKINIVDRMIKLRGDYKVVGRSIVIHADPDDGGYGGHKDSKTTGHSGERIACGVINFLTK